MPGTLALRTLRGSRSNLGESDKRPDKKMPRNGVLGHKVILPMDESAKSRPGRKAGSAMLGTHFIKIGDFQCIFCFCIDLLQYVAT